MSDAYRPLFGDDPAQQGLVGGIPPWIHPAMERWLLNALKRPDAKPNYAVIESFEMRHRLTPPRRSISLPNEMAARALSHDEYGLSLVNYILWMAPEIRFRSLNLPSIMSAILARGGSVWEVTESSESGRYRLTRRDLAGTGDAIGELPAGDRAADMLRSAWEKIASRDPDPSGAYDLAVKAVEAAAHPVVSPNRDTATLGSMLGDLRAQPQRWSFVLEDLDTVIAMGTTLWTHHYRHGTQQRDDHTLDEADAAVHLALALVRFFTGNAVTLAAASGR
jgi:hypothetical protein